MGHHGASGLGRGCWGEGPSAYRGGEACAVPTCQRPGRAHAGLSPDLHIEGWGEEVPLTPRCSMYSQDQQLSITWESSRKAKCQAPPGHSTQCGQRGMQTRLAPCSVSSRPPDELGHGDMQGGGEEAAPPRAAASGLHPRLRAFPGPAGTPSSPGPPPAPPPQLAGCSEVTMVSSLTGRKITGKLPDP